MPGRPNGSPSSRFAAQPDDARSRGRTPTRPARGLRGRARSRARAQGSTTKSRMRDHAASQQLGQVGDDDVGAVRPQRVGLADAVDADDEAERARSSRGDAGERVLEHGRFGRRDRRARWPRPGTCRAPAFRAGARARRRPRRPAPRTDRRCRPPPAPHGSSRSRRRQRAEAGVPQPRARTAPSPRTRARRGCGSWRGRARSCGYRGQQTVSASAGSLREPSGRAMPREARNERTPSERCFPSMYSSIVPHGIECDESRRPRSRRAHAEERVEHLLPRLLHGATPCP